MPYRLHIAVDQDVLRVDVEGDRSEGDPAESARMFWQEMVRECSEHGLGKVLVLSNVTGKYPAYDAYVVNSDLERFGFRRSWRIAFVNRDPGSESDLRFAQLVGQNRGFQVGLFADEPAARAWLCRD